MLDNILIMAILFSIVLSFIIVRIWRKKHFVKELYVSEGASIAFYTITIAITIVSLIVYFVTAKGSSNSWLYLLLVLLLDWVGLFVFCITYTTCIYLKEEMLIKKNIIITKKIILNRETKIIEKTDRTIIKSKKKSISISARYLSGSINNLMNDVKIIINK